MKVLIDINVLLDVILERDPWVDAAVRLLAAVESNRIQGFAAGHTLTTIHYVTSRARDRDTAAAAVTDLLRLLEVVPIEKDDLHQALVLPMNDFEDAVQAAAALKIGADHLVTRNEKDFRGLSLPVTSPATALTLI